MSFVQMLLMGAWVCILKYFDMDILKNAKNPVDDSKEDFFKGITIFAWVMVILLVLTVVFSFDKICSRSSPWTLMVSTNPPVPILTPSFLPLTLFTGAKLLVLSKMVQSFFWLLRRQMCYQRERKVRVAGK